MVSLTKQHAWQVAGLVGRHEDFPVIVRLQASADDEARKVRRAAREGIPRLGVEPETFDDVSSTSERGTIIAFDMISET